MKLDQTERLAVSDTDSSDQPATPLDLALRRAAEAAELATDAAKDVQGVNGTTAALVAQTEAGLARARRMGWIGAGLGAVALAGTGLIYARALADLHDAAEVQAAAARVFVEKLVEMDEGLEKLAALEAALTANAATLDEAAKGVGPAIDAAVKRASGDGSALVPVISDTLTKGMAEQSAALKADLMAVMAEAGLKADGGGGGAADPKLVAQMAELTAAVERLAKAGAAAPKPAPAARASGGTGDATGAGAKPAAKAGSRSATGTTRRSAPKPEPNPFRYP